MLRKITSILLSVSYVILTLSGLFMMFNRQLSHLLVMNPFHEIFAVVITVTGILHIVLNFKALKSYFSNKYIKIIFSSVILLFGILYVLAFTMKSTHEESGPHGFGQSTEINNQIQE